MFNWKVKRRIETPAEEKLELIKNMLFPPLITKEEIAKDGSVIKYQVDYSVDSNLDAALMDLQDGNNDKITQETINKVVARLNDIRRMLEAYHQLDAEAKYLIVEDLEESDVTAKEERY